MAAKKSAPAGGPYELSLDLRVLDHLGIKLYSNAAAVLSEAVANAWDADAVTVKVKIASDGITIEDDGIGMDLGAINNRFLTVGYDKRVAEGDASEKGRPFMGRKGIGKLALFSIADEIEIHTRKSNGDKHGFRMRTEEIRAAIKKDGAYRPPPISFAGPNKGTLIVLRRLKKKRTGSSIVALRKRIARRFSIIGYQGPKGDTFAVEINGVPVGPADRDDLNAIEFLWEFGKKSRVAKDCPNLQRSFVIDDRVTAKHPTWKVSGWLGAAASPKTLKNEEAGTMNGIVLLARGRLIQENILDRLNFSRILVSYLTGQVQADFLDIKGRDDIATSDRQRLIEDDPRYVAVVDFLRSTLLAIDDQWTDLRNEVRGKQAISEIPALASWIKELPASQQRPAGRMLGLIRGLQLPKGFNERATLYRSGIVAFERLRLRDETEQLTRLPQLTADILLPLLADLETLEASMYMDIVRARLDVIKEFENLVDDKARETVLQKHLFEHLWLLDPGWERAATSPRIEQTLKTEYGEFAKDLKRDEKLGRVDIRYRTNADQHIIVELKRAGRRTTANELVEQGKKYERALRTCLENAGFKQPHISIVFVVGAPLRDWEDPGGREFAGQLLDVINGRAIHYEELIRRARDSYQEYLSGSAKVDKIEAILAQIAAAAPPDDGPSD